MLLKLMFNPKEVPTTKVYAFLDFRCHSSNKYYKPS